MAQVLPHSIVTHSGAFHADDVFACAVFRLLVPGITLERTRDAERLARAIADDTVAVIDVGGVHDPAANNFDHHQRGFDGRRDDGAPLASFGLVWAVWGAAACGGSVERMTDEDAQVALRVDGRIGVFLDAVDVGALLVHTRIGDTEYGVHPYDLSDVVGDWNPEPGADAATLDAAFEEAVVWATGILARHIAGARRELAAAAVVDAADDGSSLLVLERAVPWVGHTHSHHLVVVCPGSDGHWNARVVPNEANRFESRMLFPVAWAGLRDAELAAVSGVDDAVFCHSGRFIAVARTRDGAIALAASALAMHGWGTPG